MAMVSLESCYERARKAMAQGEHDRAEAVCRHIQQYYPQDLGAFQLLGQINLERKQGREARDFFRRVLEIDPENVSAHWGMGIAYQDEGKLEQAIAEFEQALEIKPDLSDLRSQLLRLYTEMYGASQAQLRLSRAGLGRLYAKGRMLDKAIAEFREVLKLDPARVDVRMSLLDALWQSGNIEGAARVAEEALAVLPDALKANLILGYVRISAGFRDAGEELWRKAEACDPNNTMARVLLESAPTPIPPGLLAFDAATLPDFDEAAWKAQVAEAAARPRVEAPPPPPAPVPRVEKAPPPAPVPARAATPEPAGVSWLDALATGEGEVREEAEIGEIAPGLVPFSLEGIDLEAGALPETPRERALGEAAVGPPPVTEEIFAEPPAEPAIVAPPSPEPEMRPFSLADLGLSPEEIASLEEAVAATRPAGAAPAEAPEMGAPEEEGLPGIAPFSLEEVGPAGEEAALPSIAPFSLEEVGPAGAPEEIPGIAPFTLEAAVPPAGAPPGLPGREVFPGGPPAGLEAFSLEELGTPAGGEGEGLLGDVEPFSIESLGLEGAPLAPGLGEEDLKPFSLEDLGLEEPVGEVQPAGLDRLGEGEDLGTALPAFSWQEAGTSKAPAFRGELQRKEEEPSAGPTLFEKMMASRREAGEEAAPPAGLPEAEEVLPVEAAAPAPVEELGLEEVALAGLKPFSVESFGLEEPSEGPLQPFSLAELGLEEVAGGPAAAEPGGMAPFSLAELGLEETLAPPVGEAAPVEEAPAAAVPFSLEELGVEVGAPAAEAAAPGEEIIQPFTLEELGLTPEEIAALGTGMEEAPAAPAGVAEEVAPAVVEEAPAAVEEAPAAVVEVVSAPPAGPSLEELRQQLAAQPDNEGLALALARVCMVQGEAEEAAGHYRRLIKTGSPGLTDALVGDLQDWITQEQDSKRLYRLHRLLGDAYMKKGWYQQAIAEYAWVLSK